MEFKFVLFFATCAVISCGQGAKIIGIFPMPGLSHYILYSKLMKGLAEAGHDITMVSPYKLKEKPKNGTFTDIVLEDLAAEFHDRFGSNTFDQMKKHNIVSLIQIMTDIFIGHTNNTFYNPEVRKLVDSKEKFDAVILEQFSNDGLKVFAHLFNCPLIILSSMGPNAWVNPMVGNPQPVSYVGHLLMGDFSKDLSFVNRATNLYFYIVDYFLTKYYIHARHEEIMHKAFPNSPPLYDLYTNVSLILLNSHTSFYSASPVVPNMVEIGGYFIDPPKKLPQDLQEFLDSAKDGVIYFSMGSNLKSKDLPQEKKQLLLNTLGKLKEKVLWKFEEDLPNKPSNIMIRKWLPQQDVLAHPNIKLFITHGGLLSTTETIYHGVPVLAIPVFGDQNSNADRAVANGYGLKLEYVDPNFNVLFGKLINELLHNPRYREDAQRRSKIYHDRQISPMQTAVYWVEYVIRHKGAPHLRVAGVRLPWYKYFLVDVLGFILLISLVVFLTLKIVLRKLFCKSNNSNKLAKKQKTN